MIKTNPAAALAAVVVSLVNAAVRKNPVDLAGEKPADLAGLVSHAAHVKKVAKKAVMQAVAMTIMASAAKNLPVNC